MVVCGMAPVWFSKLTRCTTTGGFVEEADGTAGRAGSQRKRQILLSRYT